MGDVIAFARPTTEQEPTPAHQPAPARQPKSKSKKTKAEKWLEEYERTFDRKVYHDRTALQQACRSLSADIITPVFSLPENMTGLAILLMLHEKIGDLRWLPSRYR